MVTHLTLLLLVGSVIAAVMVDAGVAVVEDNVTVDLNSREDKQSSPWPSLPGVIVRSGLVLESMSAWVTLNGWARRTACVLSRMLTIHVVKVRAFEVGRSTLKA